MTNILETCSESQLFGIIYSLGGFIFYARHDAADGRIEWTDELEEAVLKASKKTAAAVCQTVRFGVESPMDKDGNGTENYWEWYHKVKPTWTALTEHEKCTILKGVSDEAD